MRQRRGFTLVELAIVLVIIGLLIGGILAAQSMIATARIQAAIRTLQQFDTAVSNFQLKYNSIPGDSTIFTPPGNGNGKIEDAGHNSFGFTIFFNGETANCWPHLQQGGFMSSGPAFLSTIATNFSVGSSNPNSPKVVWDNTGVICYQNSGYPSNQHFWLLGNYTNVFTSSNLALLWPASMASIPAEDVLALDTKIDDGTPAGLVWPQNVPCSSGASYNIGVGAKCNLAVPMMISSGRQQN